MPSVFFTKRVVLAIHRDQIETFGGSTGIRDEGALESALAQPSTTFGDKLLHPEVIEQATAYLFHLVTNHPFVDGNERAGFAAMDTFLRMNGYRLMMSDHEAFELVMGIASGEHDKAQATDALRSHARRSEPE